jgi:hypothetical protein
MGTHLIFAGDLPGRSTGVEGPHRGGLEITTVDSSGQIHFLTPFNVFGPLTCCLILGFTPQCPRPMDEAHEEEEGKQREQESANPEQTSACTLPVVEELIEAEPHHKPSDRCPRQYPRSPFV